MTEETTAFANDLSYGFKEITKVFKRVRDVWVEWVMVAESAILRSVGIRGWGLYALKRFSRGERIGVFGGVMKRCTTSSNEAQDEAARQSSNQGAEYCLAVRLRPTRGGHTHRGGIAVIDGVDGPPPFLHLINDAYRSSFTNNVRFDQYGTVEASRTIMPANLQVSNLFDLARSELLVPYQQDYWRHKRVR